MMAEMIAMIAANIRIIMHTPAGIKSGENTHHHDQAMSPISLAITKMIVSTPESPIFCIALVLIYLLMENGELPLLAGCHAV
jgi:hypothetical protein